jgi:hypothetical protein
MFDFFCDPLEDKIVYIIRVEDLFVLRPVVDLSCVSVFNVWAWHKKTLLLYKLIKYTIAASQPIRFFST